LIESDFIQMSTGRMEYPTFSNDVAGCLDLNVESPQPHFSRESFRPLTEEFDENVVW